MYSRAVVCLRMRQAWQIGAPSLEQYFVNLPSACCTSGRNLDGRDAALCRRDSCTTSNPKQRRKKAGEHFGRLLLLVCRSLLGSSFGSLFLVWFPTVARNIGPLRNCDEVLRPYGTWAGKRPSRPPARGRGIEEAFQFLRSQRDYSVGRATDVAPDAATQVPGQKM